jgi:hypothetical protein
MSTHKIPVLSPDEIAEIFINTNLEEEYNFLKDDLVKLAQAFIAGAAPKIALEERAKCVQIAKDLNKNVGEKIEEVRRKE